MTELSKRLKILFEEYPGDEAWEKFVSCSPEIDPNLFSNIPFDRDILRALYWKKGCDIEGVVRWIDRSIPILDGNDPVSISKLEEGVIILRSALMRMP